jgi:hypothetical protein
VSGKSRLITHVKKLGVGVGIRIGSKSLIIKKMDACSTSEGADTKQQKANEAQKLEEEIRRLQICAKSHSFPEILTETVSYYNSIPYDVFGSVHYQMLCCPMKRRFDFDCQPVNARSSFPDF